MSMWSEREETIRKKEEEETLRKAAKILAEKYPDPNLDEWGNPRHFSS